jgi:acetyl esterase/lipase
MSLPQYIIIAFMSFAWFQLRAQDKVIRLYDGPAPGSENWKQTEQEYFNQQWKVRVVINVVDPTLTVFQPQPGKANGTAIIICPGGGFVALSIDSEGFDVARRLSSLGTTCFVLKYRLAECKTNNSITAHGSTETVVTPIIKLALADANSAVGYVRTHAAAYGVNPKHIGIIGFSAGGTVAVSAAMNFAMKTRPDFAALIYAHYSHAIKGKGVPADAPPIFVLAAADDSLVPAAQSIAIYQDWIAAGKSAELHLYSKGGHGFGMRPQRLPCDHWIERFKDWLGMQRLL